MPAFLWCVWFGFALGMAWAGMWAHERLDQRLPPSVEGEKVQVSGYVCNLPTTGSFNSIRFSFCVTRWHGSDLAPEPSGGLPGRLRLAWYGHADAGLPGHRLTLEVVLKRPHGSLNPEGFRYEDWLFRKGYRATGSVRSAVAEPTVPCKVKCQYHRLHARLAHWVDREFAQARQHALIASLLIGNRSHLTPAQWDLLQATGTIHLVAISGLHIGLVALGIGFIARRCLLAVSARHMTERLVRLTVFSLVFAGCVMYALAAGFTVPTRRALIMVAVASWCLLKARQMPAWHSLVVALGLVLLLDPFAPLDQGFWLSFGAVTVLVCVFAGRLAGTGWLTSLVVAQGAVFAGLWPILDLAGQGQPLAGMLANLFAIPWVSLVVMPVLVISGLLVALSPALAPFVIPLPDTALSMLWWVINGIASMNWPLLEATTPEIAGFAALALFVILVPFRALRLCGLVTVLLWGVTAAAPGEPVNPTVQAPEVRIWDVGQGFSALLRAGDQVLLYDSGPEVKGVYSAAESVLLPNLRALGIRRIDTLVISHADSDHSGGLDLLASRFHIGRVITGEPDAVRNKLSHRPEMGIFRCAGNESLGTDQTLFFWQAAGNHKGNDASCVLTLRNHKAGVEWVFPGDISSAIEPLYLQTLAARESDHSQGERVVVAPHHGSKTSSSDLWVTTLSPDLVIYTAGYRHRYGHPHREVAARYRQAGVPALNTACSGALMMTAKEGGLQIREERHRSPFWINAPGLARDLCSIP